MLELFYNKTADTISESSLSGYKYDINGFCKFLLAREEIEDNDENICRSILHANEADIVAYINYARDVLNNRTSALNRKISSLKKLYNYLYDNKLMNKNIASSIGNINVYAKTEKKILTVEQCRVLLDSVTGRNKLRDSALIMIFLFCGLNVGEVLSLEISDISSENIITRINGEVKKKISKNEALRLILNDFISRERIDMSEKVFTTRTGKPLSKRKHITIGELQYYLGHKNISTTSNYVKSALRIGKEKTDKNPLANYKKT